MFLKKHYFWLIWFFLYFFLLFFTFLIRFNNGEKVGVHWRWGRGNVYNVGEIDLENQPEGEGSLYLYPDIKTIIQGDYEKGRMKTGRLVKLIG